MNGRLIGVLAAMIALLGAGLATGTRVYYALFFLLLLMLLFSLASVLWTLLSARVTMKGVKPRAERGDRLMTILNVRHTSLLPAGSLRVELNVPANGGSSQEISISSKPFAKSVYRSMIRCPHRGNYEVGIRSMRAVDLFGLFEIRKRSRKRLMRVEVYPKARFTPCMQLKAQDTGPEYRSTATEDNASPSDIRKWQEGDELKKIHWKLSLRKRELMVRSFEDSARPDTLIIPDLSGISALQDQRLAMEDGICEACLGAAKAQLEEGFPVRMPLQCARPQELSGKTNADLAGFTDALTRVRFDSPYPYEQVLALMMQRMQRTGGIVLATAKVTMRTADLALRMQKSGMQVKLIWVTDTPKDEALAVLERLKMAGVVTELENPWQQEEVSEIPLDF